jgi:RNA polymerase sigma factor (sigma-70 family)
MAFGLPPSSVIRECAALTPEQGWLSRRAEIMITEHLMTGSPEGPQPGSELLSTLDLLERFKSGDQQAVNLLVERSIPPLRRWARGRLPGWARGIAETQDLVQTALMRALPRLKEFEARHPGALQAYLRQAVANHIRDEIRKVVAHPPTELSSAQPDLSPSPLEQAIGREAFERYEAALATLRAADREAIVARVELQQSYEEVAIALQKPNANAARVAVARAVKNLVKAMAELAAKSRPPQV